MSAAPIAEQLAKLLSEGRLARMPFVAMRDLLEALAGDGVRPTAAVEVAVRAWMDANHWQHCRYRMPFGRTIEWGYERPEVSARRDPRNKDASPLLDRAQVFDGASVGARLHALLTTGPLADARFVTLSQITSALDFAPTRQAAYTEQQVRSWMEARGWLRCKSGPPETRIRAWGYRRPACPQIAPLSPQSHTEHSGQLRTRLECAAPAMPRRATSPIAGQQACPPRAVQRAQSLLRRFGIQLSWVPSGATVGEVERASLVISRAPAQHAGGAR